MSALRFALVTEGSSDRGILPHLEELCSRAGAGEVEGSAPNLGVLPQPPGKRVAEQVRAALGLVPEARIIFVHRDADSSDDTLAQRDIESGVAEVDGCPRHVGLVPIQELEAWLLTDEQAIRDVAGNPGGRTPLHLPKISGIERLASPKERLEQVLVEACELSGRRLKAFRKAFPYHRSILLERLDIDGKISRLPAWQRFVSETTRAVKEILATQ